MKKKVFYPLLLIILFQAEVKTYSQILKLEQIKPGMKGYIITADRANKKKKFKFEVIDVIKKISAKKDIILVKFYGKYIEKKGIAQGMSGSPAYIDNKLVGALAYTWGYLKEPIGGIQPIEQMLPVLENKSFAYHHNTRRQKFISLEKEIAKKLHLEYVGNEETHSSSDIRPITTPLIVSGLPNEFIKFLKEKLHKTHFNIIEGGKAGEKLNNKKQLFPGDAVAIPLVTGDANVAAIGTVTYRKNNKVLIFGHPFLGRGNTNLPMAKAFVHYIMPTLTVSWKFSSAGPIIGTIYNDQETGVAGYIGKPPAMIPVTIEIKKENQKFFYHYKMAKDPLFFPTLLSGIIMSSFSNIDPKKSEGSICINIKVNIRNHTTYKKKSFSLNDFFVGFNSTTIYQTTMRLIHPLQYIVYNWFGPWEVESINIKIHKILNYRIGYIEKATLIEKSKFTPGEIVKIKLYIRKYKDSYEEKIVNFKIPANIKTPTTLIINISSSKIENITYMQQYTPLFIPKNIDQLLAIFSRESSFNDIALWIDIPQTGLIIDGQFFPNMPLSKIYYYGYRQSGNYLSFTSRKKVLLKTDFFVTGYLRLPIKILPK